MTREELIRYGNDYYRDLVNACCEIDEKHKEFVRESLKALEQQPCENAISREDAIRKLRADTLFVCTGDKMQAISDIEDLPPVTPQKYGKWIAVYQGDEIINYRCSECELGDTNGSIYLYGWDYCRRCGARMVEPQKSEEQTDAT